MTETEVHEQAAALAAANLFRCPRMRTASDLIIGYSRQRESEAAHIYLEALRRGVNAQLLPFTSSAARTLPDRLAQLIGACPARPTAVLMAEDDQLPPSAWSVLRDSTRLVVLSSCRKGYSPFEYLADLDFDTPPDALLHLQRATQEVIVRSGSGKRELAFSADPGQGWHTDLAEDPAGALVLPAGQVSCGVLNASGSFEADLAFGLNRPVRMDVRLTGTPVAVKVADGRVTDFLTAHPYLRQLLSRAGGRHGLNQIEAVTVGVSRYRGGFTSWDSQVNRTNRAVRLTIGVGGQPYTESSAGLRLELIGTRHD